MPVLTWTQSIALGATFEPLNGWQYEYIPFGGAIRILHDAGAVGVVSTVTSGSDTLQERSPVSAGGTTGVLPSVLDVPEVVDQVAAGDRQKILYENTTGGAIVVNGFIDYRPGG
jgi:hypothetical protein